MISCINQTDPSAISVQPWLAQHLPSSTPHHSGSPWPLMKHGWTCFWPWTCSTHHVQGSGTVCLWLPYWCGCCLTATTGSGFPHIQHLKKAAKRMKICEISIDWGENYLGNRVRLFSYIKKKNVEENVPSNKRFLTVYFQQYNRAVLS